MKAYHAGNAMAKRSGGEKSLDPWDWMTLITQLLLRYLSVFRGRYVPVWAMAGTGTPANLNIWYSSTTVMLAIRVYVVTSGGRKESVLI